VLLASGKGRRRDDDDDDDDGASDCLLPQRKKKKTHLRSEFQNKATQRRQQNKTKQSTRSSALTALFGSENGVFWYFGHTTRVGLPAFVGFRLKF
jgi:hypothetical protein